ncbi:fimbrial family protein [Delftia acidovorans]|jgi:major type 1 subunit fimbrin (pilin)|uniref:fimbrial protein n=1 Tax=Delftia TaxID=80865 RepID=UPI00020E7D52|nr:MULTISPECIES: fimbrial protein [Delftia]PIF35573.1 major type 1 subunit fimbrin (pilin) [Burkholderiales bacterium 23]AEF87695.1 Fimbrial protein domain-containing protein [Delftia sp. Cs1-4]APE51359.1 fimbrial protein [Delftia sp. HK171]ATH12234.1 type 1 fimbrial protein [Delftia acidovorans]EZP57875.1 Major type 1 subunit fimbrin (Pilin) [Delftia sp. RIT313]
MKKIALLTSVAGLVMMAMNTAQAADGTINFTGEVVTTTCKVDTTVAGAAKDGVKLPNVANNQLATVGATVGRQAFSLELSGCELATATSTAPVSKVAVFFEAGPNVDLVTGMLKPAAASGTGAPTVASGVQIAIVDPSNNERLKIGSAQSRFVDIDNKVGGNGRAIMRFASEYVATGPVTAGRTDTSVTYSLVYQ